MSALTDFTTSLASLARVVGLCFACRARYDGGRALPDASFLAGSPLPLCWCLNKNKVQESKLMQPNKTIFFFHLFKQNYFTNLQKLYKLQFFVILTFQGCFVKWHHEQAERKTTFCQKSGVFFTSTRINVYIPLQSVLIFPWTLRMFVYWLQPSVVDSPELQVVFEVLPTLSVKFKWKTVKNIGTKS